MNSRYFKLGMIAATILVATATGCATPRDGSEGNIVGPNEGTVINGDAPEDPSIPDKQK